MDTVALDIRKIRDQLLSRGLKAAAVLGFFTLAGSLSRIFISGWHSLMFLHVFLYLVVLGLAIWGRHVSYSLRAYIISGVSLVLGIGLLFGGGFASFGILALFCFSIISTILLGNRAGILSCLICIVVVGIIGVCVHSGILAFESTGFLELNSTILWITAVFAMALSAGIIVVILGQLNHQVERLAHLKEEQNKVILDRNRMLKQEIVERDRVEKERTALEEKLQMAKKMESVGLLAGGVAHDLNNTLGSIISYPELLLMDLPLSSPLREPLEKIKNTGFKAATIVNDMLALTRTGMVTTEVFDLNSIVTEYLKSSEFTLLITFHPKVQIEIKTDKKSLNVRGSSFHLSRVLMNLISNAAEAMKDGGRIIVSTESRNISCEAGSDMQLKQGTYAVMCVSDTGIGIPEGDLEKIFEPFYTKKTMGRSGTGLGMSVVWNIVKDHGGHVAVDSVDGEGTLFTIYIPITDEEVTVPKYPYSQKDVMGRGESILVVDDVSDQRDIMVKLLERMGYSVSAVGSGAEAIEYLSHSSVDLLILDMIMDPGMDGLETYKKVLEINPKQKAIIASGYSETVKVKEALSLGAGTYLKKPIEYNQIGRAVRTELDKYMSNGGDNPGRWN